MEKLIANLYHETEYVIHIRNLKQALNHGLVLKKFIEWLNLLEKPTLKPYIDMNTNLIKTTKNDFEKDFFKMMNNLVFSETIQKRRNYFVSEPNYHTEMFLTSRLLAIEIRTN